MKFFHNRIVNPVTGGPSFEDWLKKTILAEQKSAECGYEMGEMNPGQITETHKPAAPGDDKQQDKKVLINNDPNYQKGESVDGKKNEGKKSDGKKPEKSEEKSEASSKVETKTAHCGKEMGESNDAGKVTTEHTDAAPGDDKSDIKTKINNDPNYQKGESVSGKKDQKEGPGKKDKSASKSIHVTKTAATKLRKIATLDRPEKILLLAELGKNPKNPMPYIEAMVGLKVANLTGEEKKFLKDFWLTQFPEDYVEEMIKDR